MSLLNKSMKLGGNEYGTDLGPINEDARSAQRSFARETQGSEIARSMRGSTESLVPPPPPAKDPRHQKQVIADELRYSDPDLPETWRRDAAANAETASSRSRSQPPRNVRVPAHLKMPAPLSPPRGPAPLNHMRARSMSGSTGKSGWSQPPNMMDLASRPSLRRVKEKRPISPSDFGSPYSGTINVEPPSQSSSQVPLSMSATPQMDRYLSPNYQTQPLPQPQTQPLSQPQNSLPSGFIPQSFTMPAQITVPVTFKGKSISSPVTFPTDGGSGDDHPPPRSPSGLSNYRASAHGGSNTSLNRPRSTSINASSRVGEPAPPARPLSALSNSNVSHKSVSHIRLRPRLYARRVPATRALTRSRTWTPRTSRRTPTRLGPSLFPRHDRGRPLRRRRTRASRI
ncbi:hypothetical protein B0H11DRAFT_1257602 [Mycena galericulata]|nr:hypothetical protein B0H11DRAFT_1257602 [Mycena galericulata]